MARETVERNELTADRSRRGPDRGRLAVVDDAEYRVNFLVAWFVKPGFTAGTHRA
jgi:hypothetical protein